MHWGAKFKAALQGDVDGTDVTTLIASSRPLYTLQQQVSDRKLDLQLAHPQEPWRVLDAIGPLAAPLWIADTTVALAQSLCDAEAQAHPQTPTMMGRETHEHALALLALVDPIMAEASTALADASYRMNLRMPVPIGIHDGFLGTLGFIPLNAVYLRGLVQGAERAQGAAGQTIQDYRSAVQAPDAPEELKKGLDYVGGQVAAADVRLESVHARIAPLLANQKLDDGTLQQLIVESWTVIETYTIVGQLALYPRLIPGVPPAAGSSGGGSTAAPAAPFRQPSAGTSAPATDQSPSQLAAPAPAPRPANPAALPSGSASPGSAPPAPEALRPATPQSLPVVREDIGRPLSTPRPLPQIGATRAPSEANTGPESTRSQHEGAHSTTQGSAAPATSSAPPSSGVRALPEIGRSRAQPAAQPAVQPASIAPTQSAPSRPAPTWDTPRPGPGRPVEAAPAPAPTIGRVPSRRITEQNRWLFASSEVRHGLRAAGKEEAADQALRAFWQQRDWTVYQDEEEYLLRVNDMLQKGAIEHTGRGLEGPPYAAIYRVLADKITVRDTAITVDSLFSYNHETGHVMIV